jgi:hydrogenase expression/formation protein HypC
MCLGIPGEIVEIGEEHGLRVAKVRFGGITRQVCLECQPDAAVGEFVLVHVGFAIARIDRDEAARTWQALVELGETAELERGEEGT